jgi:glycosidase
VDSWVAWDGASGWLPKFKQTPTGDLVAPVKRHLFDITERWMDPNGDGDPSDGIDGWRLDVPLDIGGSQGAPFWRDWRKLVKKTNPDAVIVAEIWDDKSAKPFLRGGYFDTQMHYPFAEAVTEWLGVDPEMTSEELDDAMAAAFDDFPQTNLIHQNLMDSHDTDRYVSKLMNPYRGYDQGNRIQDEDRNDHGTRYREERPSDEIYEKSLLGVAIQSGYIGAPMIYYGDEYGMWGADDPSDRKPLPWPDTGPNKNAADNPVPGLRRHYADWMNLRGDPEIGPVLRYGDVRNVDTGDADVFAFVRSLNGLEVWFVVNKGGRSFDAAGILPDSARATTVGPVGAKYWVVEP